MMELKAVIVEDEANSREILRNYLSKYCENITLLGEGATIEEGLQQIKKHKGFDLRLPTWQDVGS